MRQCKAMKKKIGNVRGVGGLYMTPLERKFRGGRGSNRKNHLYMWGGIWIFSGTTHFTKKAGVALVRTRKRTNVVEQTRNLST